MGNTLRKKWGNLEGREWKLDMIMCHCTYKQHSQQEKNKAKLIPFLWESHTVSLTNLPMCHPSNGIYLLLLTSTDIDLFTVLCYFTWITEVIQLVFFKQFNYCPIILPNHQAPNMSKFPPASQSSVEASSFLLHQSEYIKVFLLIRHFADRTKSDDLLASTEDYIHIRIQQRNNRETITIAQVMKIMKGH